MTQGNYQSSSYQSIPVTDTYQGNSNSVSNSYQGSSTKPVQMYAPSNETESPSKVMEVSEEPSQMYQSDEAIEEINTATEDNSTEDTGTVPQRLCCGRGCYDCVLFTR